MGKPENTGKPEKGNSGNNASTGEPPPPLLVAPISETPPAVTGLSAEATATQVELSWDPIPDATTYWIYRDTYVPAIVPTTVYIDKGSIGAPIYPGTTYTYKVAAVIGLTLRQQSEGVVVTTLNE